MIEVETAANGERGTTAKAGLARWAGVPLSRVDEVWGDARRVAELIESRQYVRPLTGAEALRHLYEKRYAPGDKPRTGASALGELRALKAIWAAEDQASYRPRLTGRQCLEIIEALKWGP
jgi:hypothetical protein